MPRYAFPVLTPTPGLGSGSRIVGAATLGSPRSKNGSAGRIYAFLKNRIGSDAALNYIREAAFGPFVIQNGRLVWN
jgi:hypothetical protein